MAFIRCGGGGALTETTLWTNSDPTSSFSEQSVTLSDNISNYTYLKFEFKRSLSVADYQSIIIPVDTITKYDNSSDTTKFVRFTSPAAYYSGYLVRTIYYVDDTSIHFSTANKVNASSSGTGFVIPTNIYGLK